MKSYNKTEIFLVELIFKAGCQFERAFIAFSHATFWSDCKISMDWKVMYIDLLRSWEKRPLGVYKAPSS